MKSQEKRCCHVQWLLFTGVIKFSKLLFFLCDSHLTGQTGNTHQSQDQETTTLPRRSLQQRTETLQQQRKTLQQQLQLRRKRLVSQLYHVVIYIRTEIWNILIDNCSYNAENSCCCSFDCDFLITHCHLIWSSLGFFFSFRSRRIKWERKQVGLPLYT